MDSWLSRLVRLLNPMLQYISAATGELRLRSIMQDRNISIFGTGLPGKERRGEEQKPTGRTAQRIYGILPSGNDYTFNIDHVKINRRVLAPYRENGKPKDWIEDKESNLQDYTSFKHLDGYYCAFLVDA